MIVRPAARNVLERRHALPLELLVADGEDFVEQHDVRIEVRRDGKAEPHVHAGRVVLDWDVHEVLEPRVRGDAVVDGEGFGPRQSVNRRVQEDVFRPVSSGWKPVPSSIMLAICSAPPDQQMPTGRLVNAGDQLEKRALPRAVSADEGERLSLVDAKRHAAQRPEILAPLPRARAQQAESSHLDLAGVVAQHEPLREILRLDR